MSGALVDPGGAEGILRAASAADILRRIAPGNVTLSRKLYVHIGPRKTATSAIQAVLAKHDNSVVIYPKVGLWDSGNHHGLVFKVFAEQRPQKKAKGRLDKMLDAISKETRGNDRNIIISSEALESLDVGAFVRTLLPHIDSPVDVEILFTCREHFSRAASWYNHRLRSRRSKEWRTPDEFLKKSGGGVCYAKLVESLRSSGYKVSALNYHPSEDWIKRFLLYIGFPETSLPEIESRLIAFSPKTLIVTLALKNISNSTETVLKYMKHFRNMPGSRSPSRFIFGREAARFAETKYSVDRKFLESEFGIHLTPPNFEIEENALFINRDEFADIVAIAESLGEDGRKIVAFVERYVRDDHV